MLRVGAREHQHLDGTIGLGHLSDGDQVADQFGLQQIHSRRRNLDEQNGSFPAQVERIVTYGIGQVLVRGVL